MVTEDSSSDGNASSASVNFLGNPSSPADVESSNPSEENIPYAGDQLARAMTDSSGSSEDDNLEFVTDEMVFDPLEADYNDDGNGLDIDDIYKFIKERYALCYGFRVLLENHVRDLVSKGQIEKVGNRYKISHGYFDTLSGTTTRISLKRKDSSSAKPEDTSSPEEKRQKGAAVKEDKPSTSSSLAPEENPQIDAAVKEVAEAEDLEFQAKEAKELADKHAQLPKC